MKKRIMAVAVVMAMVASLTACGQKKTKVTLCDYKGIALESVSDAEFKTKIDAYIAQFFVENKEVEGPVEVGDTANINYCGKLNGVAFEGGTDDSEEGYDLVIGSGNFIEGFEEGLIGAKKGQSRDLNLTFPENYREGSELNGAAVVFTVTVNKITRPVSIEVTDASVKEKLGFDTVDAFYTSVRDELNKEAYNEQIHEYLTENCKVENVPEEEIQKYCEEQYEYACQMISYYAMMYGAEEQMILQYMMGFENKEALHDYCYEQTIPLVSYQYIIKEIAKKENISATEEEFRAKGAEYAEYYGFDSYEDFIKEAGEDTFKESVILDLTVQFLIDNGKIF